METSTAPSSAAPRLRRTLTLWDLIFYGIVLIQPIAPVPLYGVAQKLSDGHFVTIILIALLAMLITAVISMANNAIRMIVTKWPSESFCATPYNGTGAIG